ncbi:MAG: hypothetical protein ACQESB_01325 [Elusimicrobiota bacterium]
MDINLLREFSCKKSYQPTVRYENRTEEKIASVIYSLSSEIEEVNQQSRSNDLSKDYLREKVKLMEIKVKHLKRLAG